MTAKPHWFVVGVKYIASVSFGKDSLAMLLKLIEEERPINAVVFYDTGMEFDAIYGVRDQAMPLLKSHGIEYVELHPSDPFLYSMLERRIKYRNKPGCHYGFGWCGGPCRWATHYKLDAIAAYKRSLHDDITDYVGIAADETERIGKTARYDKVLPLVEWDMTEADCLQYCRDRGYRWLEQCGEKQLDLYDALDRVSCWCCANKSLKELRVMYYQLPQYWRRLRSLQERIEAPMKGSGKSVFQLEKRFDLEQEWISRGESITSRKFFEALNTTNRSVA